MALASADLRRMLDDAWDDAPEGEGTLRAQLRANERASDYGASVSSTSGGGHSSTIQIDGRVPGSATQTEICRAWRTLITLFDSMKASQLSLSPPGATDDATIYSLMQNSDDLAGHRTEGVDISLIRYGGYGTSR